MSAVTVTVLDTAQVSPGVTHLRLERPAGYHWRSGQFARLGLPGVAEFRAYSIASPGDSTTLDFYLTLVRGGLLSPRLTSLRVGERALLDGEADGALLPSRLEPGGSDLWLIATGTGISPFLAISRDAAASSGYRRIILAHGTRFAAEHGWVPPLVSDDGRITAFCAVSREDGGDYRGRLTAALADGSLERAVGARISPERSRVMLCGNPAMILEVRAALKERGLVSPRFGKPGQLLAENFWL